MEMYPSVFVMYMFHSLTATSKSHFFGKIGLGTFKNTPIGTRGHWYPPANGTRTVRSTEKAWTVFAFEIPFPRFHPLWVVDTPMLSSGTTGDSRKIQLSALLVEESNNKTEGFQRERGGLGASQNHSFSLGKTTFRHGGPKSAWGGLVHAHSTEI